MRLTTSAAERQRLMIARTLMVRALEILDEAGAAGQIGSELDLAISRLSAAIGGAQPKGQSVTEIIDQLELEMRVEEGSQAPALWNMPPV